MQNDQLPTNDESPANDSIPTHKQTPPSPEPSANSSLGSPVPTAKNANHRRNLIIVAIAIFIILAGIAAWYFFNNKASAPASSNKTSATAVSVTPKKPEETVPTISSSDLKLDESKNYGNKYANGILPVGDNKYVTDAPKVGYVYLCHLPQAGGGGAGTRGPWFTNNNTQYDINKKAKVSGNVSWKSDYSITINGTTRKIYTNDLPSNHTTGVFPIQRSDAAYAYDRNPNSIGSQSLTYSLTAYPSVGTNNCIGGEVGVINTGVALFDGFDAGGRDAGAWEVQDGCGGHPQNTHEYHYHTLSNCIADTSVKTVIGYALDGFPITGPKLGDNNILTTSDLDECHGITSEIVLDGKKVISYHYVMSQDFPYSASCFKAKATQPPGRPERP